MWCWRCCARWRSAWRPPVRPLRRPLPTVRLLSLTLPPPAGVCPVGVCQDGTPVLSAPDERGHCFSARDAANVATAEAERMRSASTGGRYQALFPCRTCGRFLRFFRVPRREVWLSVWWYASGMAAVRRPGGEAWREGDAVDAALLSAVRHVGEGWLAWAAHTQACGWLPRNTTQA